MARYEFSFVVSDVDLSEEHEARISQALAQAGSFALADVTPPEAITVRIGEHRWWRGIPPVELLQQIEQAAARKAREGIG